MAILAMTDGVYLVDLDQRLLVPLDPAAPAQPLEIDNSLAGQAFRTH